MSYTRPNTGDPELDQRLADEDFDMLFPRLLEAATRDSDDPDDQRFAVWLDKLALINRDRTAAWLREHWQELNRIRRIHARLRLGREMDGLPL